ncbi:MAG: type II toxin-antitoxin system PemK/MazF family toxin [Candidatus Hodarchaeales archaeon]
MKGKIVLIPFPFTDLSSAKMRPALVIHSGQQDVIVAFISSRLSVRNLDNTVIVKSDHPDFKRTGLKVDSVIRLDKVATILKELIIGEIGQVGQQISREINEILSSIFRFD